MSEVAALCKTVMRHYSTSYSKQSRVCNACTNPTKDFQFQKRTMARSLFRDSYACRSWLIFPVTSLSCGSPGSLHCPHSQPPRFPATTHSPYPQNRYKRGPKLPTSVFFCLRKLITRTVLFPLVRAWRRQTLAGQNLCCDGEGRGNTPAPLPDWEGGGGAVCARHASGNGETGPGGANLLLLSFHRPPPLEGRSRPCVHSFSLVA